jgi:hypothetical protein
MDSDTSLITLVGTISTAFAVIDLLAGFETEQFYLIFIRVIGFSAVSADTANETLGDNAYESRVDHVRLKTHIDKTVD